MQAYSAGFAKVYHQKWGNFSSLIAPSLIQFYRETSAGQENQPILDLCCGAGHLARLMLAEGFTVTGLDLSEAMLKFASENNQEFIEKGNAHFIQGDASNFSLPGKFGLVVSTYDAMNHLPSQEALESCFQCVRKLEPSAFIFDMNTRKGLAHWNNISVSEEDDLVLINRGFYDSGQPQAWMRLTGFSKQEDGRYERFDETVFNLAVPLIWVKEALQRSGWQHVRFTTIRDLHHDLADPEKEGRVFIVAEQ
jgi:SAM-dependent methyltransferase